MCRVLLITVFLAGCLEYEFSKADDPAVDTGAGRDDEPTDADGSPGPDTGDDIDTDVPTDTGEGLENCGAGATSDSVTIDESCVANPVEGDMEARVEWSMTSFTEQPTYTQLIAAPVVGQLTDDNGDGRVDEHDIPDIVAVFDDDGADEDLGGVLRRISGDGSDSTVLVVSIDHDGEPYHPYRYASVALGDIDGDGEADIVTLMRGPGEPPPHEGEVGPPPDELPPEIEDHPVGPPPPPTVEEDLFTCHPAAFSAEGVFKWMYTDGFLDCGGHAPAIADLEGDGTVEVIVSNTILNGEDGSLQGKGDRGRGVYMAYTEMGTIPSIADLDGDGIQEVIAGNTIYAPDGSQVCSVWDPMKDGFTAVADLDGDGLGEYVMVWNHRVTIVEHDCTVTAEWVMEGSGTGGPPTIADFDADGEPEIGIASAWHYVVYEPNGVLLWAFGTTDESSHATGSTVFDFEGDGRPEVVYADEMSLWILDGMTGYERYEDREHTSRTLHEYPIVVDVDGDGYPEIVVPNGGGHHGLENEGLYVLGSVDESWIGGRSTWNQHAFNIVNVNTDLSIPTSPESNWPLHNNFRSGDVNPVAGENATDAIVLADSCVLECETGVIEITIRLANQGTAALRTDMRLTVYAVHDSGWEALEVVRVSPPIEPGGTSAAIDITLDASRIGPAGLVVIADDEEGVEAVRECNEDNNALAMPAATCD